MAGIVGQRMMDTGPLFGSQITGSGLTPADVSPTAQPFYAPQSTMLAGDAPSRSPGADTVSDPFILRDQMYGINPTPVNSVTNALMRRYRGYYS
jgi:hypothetical protein